MDASRARAVWIAAGLVAGVLLVFGQVAGHDFVDYDDPQYVTQNPHVRQGLTAEGIRWSLTTQRMGNWHPLTWWSHMLDVGLFGMRAGPHLLVNVVLHAASAVLLFLALRRMSGSTWPAAFVAAVFALHPMRAESVAWVSERKDVLAALFWMLTLLAYARYAERRTATRYGLVLASLALGLATKSMLVTLPFVLLLLDVWPLGRWRFGREEGGEPAGRLLAEKLPMFALVAVLSWITILAQSAEGAVGPTGILSFGARLQNAIESYVIYAWKTIWPAGLSFYYHHPALAGSSGPAGPAIAIGAVLLLSGITALALYRFRREPWLAVGWFWYLGTLVPVIGLVQVGMQARADRYTYLPTIGLAIAVAWAAASIAGRSSRARHTVAWAAAAAVAALVPLAAVQASHWRDTRSLAEHALAVDPGNYRGHYLLGRAMEQEGDMDGAAKRYRQALEIKPDCAECSRSFGGVLMRRGQLAMAEAAYRMAVTADPGSALPQIQLALLLESAGRLDEAEAAFERALAIDPESAPAHTGLGVVLDGLGETERALEHLHRAVELDPWLQQVHNNLGATFLRVGRLDAARAAFERALVVSPGYAVALKNLGEVAQRQGDLAAAIARFEQAIAAAPRMVDARFKLASLYMAAGRFDAASEQFEASLEIYPDLAAAHYNLGAIRARQGDRAGALPYFERALELDPEHRLARRALEQLGQ